MRIFTVLFLSGLASLHDRQAIADGRDIGSVTVKDQSREPVVHHVVFAFSFAAFVRDGQWMQAAK